MNKVIKEDSVIYNDIRDLRNKTSKEEVVVKFKKNAFGGLKAKDVEEYIASLTQQFARSEEAYKDRIEEFSTHTEMLTKERNDAMQLMQANTAEANAIKSEIDTLRQENAQLAAALETEKSRINKIQTNESERIKNAELVLELQKESDILREHLAAAQEEMNGVKAEMLDMQHINSRLEEENNLMQKQIVEKDDLLAAARKEKNEILADVALIRTKSRQVEMKRSLVLNEFSESQKLAISQTTKQMKESIASIEKMESDFYKLFDSLKESGL